MTGQQPVNRTDLGVLKLSHCALRPYTTTNAQPRMHSAPRPAALGAAWQAVSQSLH